MKLRWIFPIALLLLAAPNLQQANSNQMMAQSTDKPRLGAGELTGILDDGMDKAVVRGEYGCLLCDRAGGSSKHMYVTGITVRIGQSYQSFFFVAPTTIISGGELRKGTSVKVTYKNLINDKRNAGYFFTGEATTITVVPISAQSPSAVTPRQNGLANIKKQINAELEELKAVILRKIDKDVESTSFAFTEAEDISRSLRIAYPFKAALTVISGAINSISAAKSAIDTKKAFSSQKTALGLSAIWLAFHNAQKVGEEDLAFVFNGPGYTDAVERMIKDAQATQASLGPIPAAGFDSKAYQNVIENWLMGSQGNLRLGINTSHFSRFCNTRPPESLFGVLALKARVTMTFKEIEDQISKGNYSLQQLADFSRQAGTLKTAIIGSNAKALTVRYPSYQLNPQGECGLTEKEVSLGTITNYQIGLQQAYGSFNKDMRVEQIATVTSTAGTIVKLVTLKVGDNAPLTITSRVIGSEKLGEFAYKQVFPTKTARDLIASQPQEMLLALPSELSGVWAITLDLKNYIEMTNTKPVVDSNSTAKNEIRGVDFLNFTYSPTQCNREYKIGSSVRVRNGVFRIGRINNGAEFGISHAEYGDLNGDGNEDALVTAFCIPTPSNNAGMNEWFVYSIEQNGHFIALPGITEERLNQDYSRYFPGSILWRSSISIKNGYLVSESSADGPRCCPEYTVVMRYKWDGRKFMLSEQPRRTKFVEPSTNKKTSGSTSQPQQPVINGAMPLIPYEDPGACPFECCKYQRWTATAQTAIRQDRQNNSPVAFTLRAGEKFTALTGIVITTKPGQARVLKPISIGGLRAKPGEIVYTLTYQGEGFYKVWYKGKTADLDVLGGDGGDSLKEVSPPQSIWWVKVKNSKGQIGWTSQTKNFKSGYGC